MTAMAARHAILDSHGEDETYVETAVAAVVAPPVLASARFARPSRRVWLLLLLALVVAAPSVFVLTAPIELVDAVLAWPAALASRFVPAFAPSLIASRAGLSTWAIVAPFGVTLLFVASFFLLIARAGRARLTTEVLEGRRGLGGRFEVRLGRVARFSMRHGTLVLATRDGRELCRLPRLEQRSFAGLVWIVARYHGLPSSVVRALAEEPPDGLFEDVIFDGVEREFVPNGVTTLRDTGFSVSIGDTHVYLPASSALDVQHATSPWRQILAPNVRKQLVAEPGIPAPDRLPLKRLAKAVLRSNLYASHKIALLTTIAANHGGTVAESIAFPDTTLHGSTAGCDVRIRVVRDADVLGLPV